MTRRRSPRLATLTEGRPSRTARDRAVSQGEAATLFGVGRTSVQAARKVLAAGAPGLVEAVDWGEIGLNAAVVIAGLVKEEQVELVKGGPKAIRERVAQMRPTPAPRPVPGPAGADEPAGAAAPPVTR